MQMHHHTSTSVTTDHIQQYLDENKALILNILENQNTGKFSECAENQTRLQQNLMYLAAIADCQPKQSSIHLQPYMNSMQQQQYQSQSQQMMPQSNMMTQTHTPFAQQPSFTMMNQHHHALQSQLGIGGTHIPSFGQPFLGESSQGITKQVSGLTTKENQSFTSNEGVESPQKKGKFGSVAN